MAESPPSPTQMGGLLRSQVSRSDVQAALWQRFGGAEGIAERLFHEFENSKSGSPFRSKILELMVGMVTKNVAEETIDFSEHSEEELLSLLGECMQ